MFLLVVGRRGEGSSAIGNPASQCHLVFVRRCGGDAVGCARPSGGTCICCRLRSAAQALQLICLCWRRRPQRRPLLEFVERHRRAAAMSGERRQGNEDG